jgi:hypothetical protein
VFLLAGMVLTALVKTRPPSPAVEVKPWFDAKLRQFFALKAQQADGLAITYNVKPHRQVWDYLEAGKKGEWRRASALWKKVRKRSHQYPDSRPDQAVSVVWSPVMETNLALDQLSCWDEKYIRIFADEIINSIPPGSIYFGGTDPGRGLITFWCKAQSFGDPFFTITQNALADRTYINYLRFIYQTKIALPTDDELQKAFSDYMVDVANRQKLNELKPGEEVSVDESGRVAAQGVAAVMEVNSLLLKTIFENNPDHEFYVEQSYIFDWLYPRLLPHGLIMKISGQPLSELSGPVIAEDHAFWSRSIQLMIGDWLKEETSLDALLTFSETVLSPRTSIRTAPILHS